MVLVAVWFWNNSAITVPISSLIVKVEPIPGEFGKLLYLVSIKGCTPLLSPYTSKDPITIDGELIPGWPGILPLDAIVFSEYIEGMLVELPAVLELL